MYKKLSAPGGLCHLTLPGAVLLDPGTLLGAPPQTPFRLALRALAMVCPTLWQILDPPLRVQYCCCYLVVK